MTQYLDWKFVPHKVLLVLVLGLLYLPILYILVLSVSQNTIFPIPIDLTFDHYAEILNRPKYLEGFLNSLVLAGGTGLVTMALSSSVTWGIVQSESKLRYIPLAIVILPILLPNLVLGIGASIFFSELFNVPIGMVRAIIIQSVYGIAFGSLIMLAQLSRYPNRLNEVAKTYGASRLERAKEVTIPLIWPGLLGAFIIPVILAFNNFTLTFYTIGDTPTLPTITWGGIRHRIEPVLYAMSALTALIAIVSVFAIYAVVVRYGLLEAYE